jgi:uncharacterized protein
MPTDLIRYDLLVQDALRSVVRKVLSDAARSGLPGEHHFNISFKTHAPGVSIPPQMRQRYPDEMAIILQHEFWDLSVGPDGFEVSLNFSRKPERLSVPFDAITGFSDPSVPFGFKLEPRIAPPAAEEAPKAAAPRALSPAKAPSKTVETLRTSDKAEKPEKAEKTDKGEKTEKAESKPADAGPSKIVSIDAFRKK